jgi:hypothetical protein
MKTCWTKPKTGATYAELLGLLHGRPLHRNKLAAKFSGRLHCKTNLKITTAPLADYDLKRIAAATDCG